MWVLYLIVLLFVGAFVIGIAQGLHHNFLGVSAKNKAYAIFKLYAKNDKSGRAVMPSKWGNEYRSTDPKSPRFWHDFLHYDNSFDSKKFFKFLGVVGESALSGDWNEEDLINYTSLLQADDNWSEEDIREFVSLMFEYKKIDEKWTASLSPMRADTPEGRAYYEWHAKMGVPGLAAEAKTKLAEANAKQARNKVIKGAAVGGIIGGDVGAVVGAVAAKAEIDAKNNNTSK